IYRWRGGEVELIEKQISERDFPEQVSRLTLAQNFRSKTEVIHFNNHFFKSIKALFAKDIYEYKLLGQIFEDVEQQVGSKKAEGGYVEVQFFAKEGRGKESYNAKARQYLLDSIQNCLQSGYSLKDISVLVRDKKDANETARTLFKENIAFITQDSLSVDHSPAVRLLFSLLYLLNDPRNDLAKTQITFLYLTYFEKPETEVTFSELLNDFTKHDDSLYTRILPFDFTKNIFELSLLPLYELVEELVRIFQLNREPDAYLQRFQDVVLEYALTKNQSIKGFLDWWQAGRYSVILPEDQDAVQIMTIHKSKGLEFPVVIMPFCNWDFSSSRNTNILWVEPEEAPFNRFSRLPINHSKNLAESTFANDFEREEALISIDNLNLLYVAFTRAQERLLIASNIPSEKSEGIKNISQLLVKVLCNDEKLTEERTLQFGEPTQHQTDIFLHSSAEYLELPEYPVYAWRTEIDLEKLYNHDSENASIRDILLSKLPSETNLFTFIESSENALGKVADLLLNQKNDPSIGKTLLIPDYGNFKSQKAFSYGGEIYLLHAVNDADNEQDILAAYNQYAKFIAVQNGSKVSAYSVDLGKKKLEMVSEF
ncbi:MAG: 3'-5' exonuclease, partial [Bacteroidia bacterium]